MRWIHWSRGAGWLAAVVCLSAVTASAPGQGKDDAVDVKVVKYEGLTDTIKKLKGKIIVVDFWGLT